MNNSTSLSSFIKTESKLQGFEFCGIAKVRHLGEYETEYRTWLDLNYNAGMQYMERNLEKRLNPELLVENAKSVVVFLLNYYPAINQRKDSYCISKYAYGNDYHSVLKNKIINIYEKLKTHSPQVSGRFFVDTAPILEKIWATEAGLGWIGKNSLLIVPQKGSYFFVGILILDVALEYDRPFIKNYCGNCSKCIEACPGKAIISGKTINANNCISYKSIEEKKLLCKEQYLETNYIFGCDICQDVCPWNRFSTTTKESEFLDVNEMVNYSNLDFQNLTVDKYKYITLQSPISRCKYDKFMNNICNASHI